MILTKKQKELLTILASKECMTLGEIRQKYYNYKCDAKRDEMKRNSQMSGWLNKLSNKGLITINHYGGVNYSVSIKSRRLLNK